METIRRSGGLPPEGEEYEYYYNYVGFRTFCNHVGGRINKLSVTTTTTTINNNNNTLIIRIGRVLKFEEVPVPWMEFDRNNKTSLESVEEQFENLIEGNDLLIERIVSITFEYSLVMLHVIL